MTPTLWKKLGLTLLGFFLAMQLVPYGRDHANPAVIREPMWDSSRTRELSVRACFDCHSNQTVWPGYTNIAPFSWLATRDVLEGRKHLNFSEWNRPQKHAVDAAEAVREGDMPLTIYLPLHPRARLSADESEALAQGLEKTLSGSGTSDQARH